MEKAKMTEKMIRFYQGNLHDIEHFLKVHAYAELIGKLEQVDVKTQEILEMAAIVHDIACPLCRQKYGKAYGNCQEEESEALLRPFLEEFALADEIQERIIYLVCHHHTYADIDGLDYQILLEADYLVNACEGELDRDSIAVFGKNVFRTKTGLSLLKDMYCV